ncbi:hypothetical protein NPIL_143811 [Nephila pilipes]|uniref:Uncharacterized protein n=1 Tax=Nephila pilipes TaxID=299642 RepID=A0A8X6SZH0_NEPPI|nr:hypothetical protein NPIL_143811 [Nephila pilipes]
MWMLFLIRRTYVGSFVAVLLNLKQPYREENGTSDVEQAVFNKLKAMTTFSPGRESKVLGENIPPASYQYLRHMRQLSKLLLNTLVSLALVRCRPFTTQAIFRTRNFSLQHENVPCQRGDMTME